VLSGAQAGLNWSLVLKKREAYRRAFDNFDPEKVAGYSGRKIQTLVLNIAVLTPIPTPRVTIATMANPRDLANTRKPNRKS
jgi:Methyladenine glycosylase